MIFTKSYILLQVAVWNTRQQMTVASIKKYKIECQFQHEESTFSIHSSSYTYLLPERLHTSTRLIIHRCFHHVDKDNIENSSHLYIRSFWNYNISIYNLFSSVYKNKNLNCASTYQIRDT